MSDFKNRHTRFKMRAECVTDVITFINDAHKKGVWLSAFSFYKPTIALPDVEVDFTVFSTDELAVNFVDVLRVLAEIVDGHVMFESVNFAALYDGTRKTSRSSKRDDQGRLIIQL
jgi:hypothetical protein